MKNMLRSTAVLISALLFIGQIHGQEIVTDRPDQTEASSVIPERSFQIESGIQWTKINPNSPEDIHEFALPTNLLRWSINSWLEARVQLDYLLANQSESTFGGIGDLILGFKCPGIGFRIIIGGVIFKNMLV